MGLLPLDQPMSSSENQVNGTDIPGSPSILHRGVRDERTSPCRGTVIQWWTEWARWCIVEPLKQKGNYRRFSYVVICGGETQRLGAIQHRAFATIPGWSQAKWPTKC